MRDRLGVIYFPHNHFLYVVARAGDQYGEAPAKVGITSNVRGRIYTIQTSCPFRLEIVELIAFPTRQMAQDIETATHKSLQACRMAGEWFDIEPTEAYRTAARHLRATLARQISDPEDLQDTLTLMGNVEIAGLWGE